MSEFKVGGVVERAGILIPDYMKRGTIIRVIPNKDGIESFTEYDVNFDDKVIAGFYQIQLRLVKFAPNSE